MDQLAELLREGMPLDMASDGSSHEGRQMDAAWKMLVVQGGDSEAEAEVAENQRQKQNKKHHRKSRRALKKIAMDQVKKSNLEEPPPREDKAAAYLAAWAKERESEPESESRSDWHAYQARLCRDRWNESFAAAGHYGTYETITSIPPMRFTEYVDASAGPRETLQIFSVKVVGVKEGTLWPLYVYGVIAVRDTVDRKRNIIFDCQRDNFQTVTEKDPYLTLTGPSRAAVLSVRHSYIEAELKIKGSSSDSDDKDFSYLATGYIQTAPCQSFIKKRVLSSRLSTLELTVGHIVNSVEATISVEVISGEWLSGYGGVFTVSTASMEDMEITLLSFGDDGLPLEDDGKKIRLSRRVVGVEVHGRLNVAVKALLPGGSSKDVLSNEKFFTPKVAGRSQLTLKLGSCEMEVKVAWSLLLTYDH